MVRQAESRRTEEPESPSGTATITYWRRSVNQLVRYVRRTPGNVSPSWKLSNGYAITKVPPNETVLICTDSMSLAQSLEKNHWKDPDQWIKMIKEQLHELPPKIVLLWIPSHCDVAGNERADELARLGTEMEQDNTFITHKIVKAKIMNQKWRIQNEKAQAIYQNRRSPKTEIEKTWPKRVRTKFAQLRSGHVI